MVKLPPRCNSIRNKIENNNNISECIKMNQERIWRFRILGTDIQGACFRSEFRTEDYRIGFHEHELGADSEQHAASRRRDSWISVHEHRMRQPSKIQTNPPTDWTSGDAPPFIIVDIIVFPRLARTRSGCQALPWTGDHRPAARPPFIGSRVDRPPSLLMSAPTSRKINTINIWSMCAEGCGWGMWPGGCGRGMWPVCVCRGLMILLMHRQAWLPKYSAQHASIEIYRYV